MRGKRAATGRRRCSTSQAQLVVEQAVKGVLARLANATVQVRVPRSLRMDGPEEFHVARARKAPAAPQEPPQGGRKVRRALKNARTLISELFAREKSSVR